MFDSGSLRGKFVRFMHILRAEMTRINLAKILVGRAIQIKFKHLSSLSLVISVFRFHHL